MKSIDVLKKKLFESKIESIATHVKNIDGNITVETNADIETKQIKLESQRKDEECTMLKEQLRKARSKIAFLEDQLKITQQQIEEQNTSEEIFKQEQEEEEQNVSDAMSLQLEGKSFAFRLNSTAKCLSRQPSEQIDEEKIQEVFQEVQKQLYQWETKYYAQRTLNAQMLLKIQALKGNIQVCCRIRPPRPHEAGNRVALEKVGENEVGLFNYHNETWKTFVFDQIWTPDYSQEDIFREVEPLAVSVVDGYDVCIFAYGQTGSGKTHTMVGDEGSSDIKTKGICYQAIGRIFELLDFRKAQSERECKNQNQFASIDSTTSYRSVQQNKSLNLFNYFINVSMIEIYNEQIRDLLVHPTMRTQQSLELRKDSLGKIQVQGLSYEEISNVQEAMNIFRKGTQNRATAATNLNEQSSRSHCVLCVQVTTSTTNIETGKTGPLCTSRLYLVDLAGSERVNKSGVTGAELKEAQFINKSLAALGDVMEALDNKNSHIPFRNSKLTHLLQDTLGGDSITMMVFALSPTELSYHESNVVLQFASRVRNISLGPAQKNAKNAEQFMKATTEELQTAKKEKKELEMQLQKVQNELQETKNQLETMERSFSRSFDQTKNTLSKKIDDLEKERDNLTQQLSKEKENSRKLREDAENLEKQMKKAQQNVALSSRETDGISSKLIEREQEVEKLQQQMKALREERMGNNKKMSELEKDVANAKKQITSLQEKEKLIQFRLQSKEEEVVQLARQLRQENKSSPQTTLLRCASPLRYTSREKVNNSIESNGPPLSINYSTKNQSNGKIKSIYNQLDSENTYEYDSYGNENSTNNDNANESDTDDEIEQFASYESEISIPSPLENGTKSISSHPTYLVTSKVTIEKGLPPKNSNVRKLKSVSQKRTSIPSVQTSRRSSLNLPISNQTFESTEQSEYQSDINTNCSSFSSTLAVRLRPSPVQQKRQTSGPINNLPIQPKYIAEKFGRQIQYGKLNERKLKT